MNAFHQAAVSFTSQNVGAKKYDAIHKILISCLIIVAVVGLVMGNGIYLLGHVLVGIYSPDPAVIQYGVDRLAIVCTMYFLCGMMEVVVGSLRGMGASLTPMIVSALGACGLRIVWIYTIFAANRTTRVLFTSYPVTWIITTVVHIICYIIIRKRLIRRNTLAEA